ncbi:MAG: hypothetical protein ACYC61_06810 [Isosphaeraceae bacterium]
MASSKAQSFDDQEFSQSEYAEPPPQRGCLFYGCLISSILAVLLTIAVGLLFFFMYRWVSGVIDEYTATEPRTLPAVEVTAEKRRTTEERWEQFKDALHRGTATEPLILSAEDVNVLISDRPEFAGKFYVSIEGDRLRSQVSIPLEKLPVFGLTQGRYLNGEAELKAFLRDDILVIVFQSLEVNGKRLPERIMNGLRAQNLASDVHKDRTTAQEIQRLESIEIQDGRIIIKPKQPARDGTGASPTGSKGAPDPKEPSKPGSPEAPAGKSAASEAPAGKSAASEAPAGKSAASEAPAGKSAAPTGKTGDAPPGKMEPTGSTSRDPR